jgi:hypothetical protein
MDNTKTVVAVTTISGGDALVYNDGSIVALIEVQPTTGKPYFVSVPVDIETALKAEDANDATYSELPGYVAPGADQAAE